MSIIKLSWDYRQLSPKERSAYLAYHEKHKHTGGDAITTGIYGGIGALGGAAIGHEMGGVPGAVVGGIIGTGLLGAAGYRLSKLDNENWYDGFTGRMNNPDRKWLITNKSHEKVMRG